MSLEIKGLIAAVFSPFDNEGRVDLSPIPKLVEHLINNGINGLYAMGSTGEGLSMTVDQRMEVTDAYISAVNGRIPVIVNVSHTSYDATGELTRHAVGAGADAVSATLPAYYTVSSIDQLVRAVRKIAEFQNEVPFIYYHIPGKTGLNFRMHTFLERIGDTLPQLGGIKYTSGAIDDFMMCQQIYGDRYKMFFGVDELFLPALAMGADSFVGSTYNFMAPTYHGITEKYAKGDQHGAKAEYFKAVRIIDALLGYDGLASQKAIMKMSGHDFGPPRSPLQPLSRNEYDTFYKNLKNIGLF